MITFLRKNLDLVATAQSTSRVKSRQVNRFPFASILLGIKVAVKAMQKGKITDYESFKNEINILMQLVSEVCPNNYIWIQQDHPNIIKLHETWETDRIMFLVTEYVLGF